MMTDTKKNIAKAIRHEMELQGHSTRSLAEKIPDFSYPQLARISGEKNYNIDTLIKVLNALDLDIQIVKKK